MQGRREAGRLRCRTHGRHRATHPHAHGPAAAAPARRRRPGAGRRHRLPDVSSATSGDLGLNGATFAVHPGEFVFIVGASGSGKSTLMRLLIKEIEPTSGCGARRGPRPHRDHAQEGPVLPAQPRHGPPGLQAAAEPDRVRQRRLRAAGDRRHAPRGAREGAGHPAPDRSVAEAALLPRPALRRRAAARVGGPRVRQPPAAAAGRRADGQPRSRDVGRDHAAAVPDQPHGHDRRRGHARPPDGRPHAPPRDRALRGKVIRDERRAGYALATRETTRSSAPLWREELS